MATLTKSAPHRRRFFPNLLANLMQIQPEIPHLIPDRPTCPAIGLISAKLMAVCLGLTLSICVTAIYFPLQLHHHHHLINKGGGDACFGTWPRVTCATLRHLVSRVVTHDQSPE